MLLTRCVKYSAQCMFWLLRMTQSPVEYHLTMPVETDAQRRHMTTLLVRFTTLSGSRRDVVCPDCAEHEQCGE